MLTLDLGKQTGWTILNDGIVQSGSKSFHVSRFSGGGMQFLNFRNWLNSLKYKFPGIEVVYFEEVRRHLGTDAAHIYGGFLAHLSAWCEESNISYQGVSVKTIKRFITGKGNASKADVIEAVQEKGFCPMDDNEADSLALMFYVMNFSKDFNILKTPQKVGPFGQAGGFGGPDLGPSLALDIFQMLTTYEIIAEQC